jgi:WS/DGAT/MGAT family acyltransferase
MANTLMQEGMATLQHPGRVIEFGALATESAGILAHTLLMPGDPKTPFKGKLHVSKRVAVSPQIELDEVKRIGELAGGKVNDVLLAAMTGALRDYLIQHGAEADGLTIRAVVPVNLRPVERALELGNEFGLVFLELPIGLKDPLARVTNIRQQMDRIKKSPEAFLFFGVLSVFGLTPRQIEDQVVNIFGTKATAVMTNVAGPSEELFFAGSSIDHVMFWVPQAGHLGLGVSIYSYNGKVTLGVITDALLVPDPERITDRFAHEFAVLKQTALAKRAPAPEPAAPPRKRATRKRQPKATAATAAPVAETAAPEPAPVKRTRRRKSAAPAGAAMLPEAEVAAPHNGEATLSAPAPAVELQDDAAPASAQE